MADQARCPMCEATLPVEMFPKDASRSTGRGAHCKPCRSKRRSEAARARPAKPKPPPAALARVIDLRPKPGGGVEVPTLPELAAAVEAKRKAPPKPTPTPGRALAGEAAGGRNPFDIEPREIDLDPPVQCRYASALDEALTALTPGPADAPMVELLRTYAGVLDVAAAAGDLFVLEKFGPKWQAALTALRAALKTKAEAARPESKLGAFRKAAQA